jgi:hypothetical protein
VPELSLRPAWTRGAAALFVLLAVVHTWPLSSAPWRRSLNYHADAQLNAWIVSWIAHTLPTAPAHLFDANIFAPEPATLAYSEPLIAPALLVAPVRWLGGSPVLAFNLLTILGLALTGWSAWFVAWRWTGSPSAALIAGSLAAFNVHVLTRLAHPAATHAWILPLVWYFADALLERPSVRAAVALAVAVAITAATSIYLLAFAGVIVLVVAIVGARRLASLAAVAGACLVGLTCAAPVLWPYIRLARGGNTRPIEMVAQFSASPAGYLASTSWLEAAATRRFFTNDVNVMFAGAGALALAALGLAAIVPADRMSRRRIVTMVVLGLVGVVLSLGPSTSLYRWLYAWVPPLGGLRAAARFGYLYLLAVAFLAAYGLAWLERRFERRRAGALVVAGAMVLAGVEAWQGPVRTVPFTGVPAIYSLLAETSERVQLVEVPFYPPEAVFENGEYVFNSTAHWRPLMNGYSGLTPDSYRRRAESFWYFPESWAIDAIRREGATHVMVHLKRFTPEEAANIERVLLDRHDLQLVAGDPLGNRLYRVAGNR